MTGSSERKAGGTIDTVVRLTVVPVANLIALAASKGILLVVFGGLWLLFGAAVLVNPDALTQIWRVIGEWPLPLQAIVWVLLLPLMIGLWIWQTDWAYLVRLALIAALAAWNVLVFIPRSAPAGDGESAAR